MAPSDRSRGWCFTINNFTDDDVALVLSLQDKVDYLVAGREVGEETQTPHIQGYLYKANNIAFSKVKKYLPRAHIEIAKGSPDQNKVYCTKQQDILIEHGMLPQQGKRTDLHDVIDAVKAGATIKELIQTHTTVVAKYPRFIEIVKKTFAEPRDVNKPPTVKCYWGPPGTGKTRTAFEEFCGDCYMKTPTTEDWWDGYDSHENVIIDEADKGYLKISHFLSLLDRYPVKVKVKGSFVEFTATSIILTANKHPEDWYQGCTSCEREGLLRRIHHVERFGDLPSFDPTDEIDELEPH